MNMVLPSTHNETWFISPLSSQSVPYVILWNKKIIIFSSKPHNIGPVRKWMQCFPQRIMKHNSFLNCLNSICPKHQSVKWTTTIFSSIPHNIGLVRKWIWRFTGMASNTTRFSIVFLIYPKYHSVKRTTTIFQLMHNVGITSKWIWQLDDTWWKQSNEAMLWYLEHIYDQPIISFVWLSHT